MYGKWRFINFKSYITINLYLKKADFLIPKKKFSSFFLISTVFNNKVNLIEIKIDEKKKKANNYVL